MQGRCVIITGAAGNIGAALVDRFLDSGAHVIGADLVATKISHPQYTYVALNQSSVESITKLEAYVESQKIIVHCLINNGAVGGHTAPFHEKTAAEFDSVTGVNIKGSFLILQMILRIMLRQSAGGTIINICSTAAHRAAAGASLYSASKSWLLGLTRTIAAEYADRNIRCLSISPGVMEIPNIQGIPSDILADIRSRIPAQRGGKPREIADLAVFLASDAAAYITGSDFLIDGGKTNI